MKRSFNSNHQSINSTSTTTKSNNGNNDEKSDDGNKSSLEESSTHQKRNDDKKKDNLELFDRDQPLAFLSGPSFAKEILQQVFEIFYQLSSSFPCLSIRCQQLLFVHPNYCMMLFLFKELYLILVSGFSCVF